MIFVVLAVLGLILGSFVNALVWRVRVNETSKKAKLSIVRGRSQCPSCHHELAARDLVPVLSWLALRGKCRYCRKPISWQYPAVEVATAAVFVLLYSYWPNGVYGVGDWTILITWMVASVGLLALLTYDLLWMELPNRILYPTLLVAAAGRLMYLVSFEPRPWYALGQWALSILIASGFFWLIFTFSRGRLIGYGDVRLGLVLGTLLADPQLSFLMIFGASILGTLATVPAMVSGNKNLTSRIAFGPFLIISALIVALVGSSILDWYRDTFIH